MSQEPASGTLEFAGQAMDTSHQEAKQQIHKCRGEVKEDPDTFDQQQLRLALNDEALHGRGEGPVKSEDIPSIEITRPSEDMCAGLDGHKTDSNLSEARHSYQHLWKDFEDFLIDDQTQQDTEQSWQQVLTSLLPSWETVIRELFPPLATLGVFLLVFGLVIVIALFTGGSFFILLLACSLVAIILLGFFGRVADLGDVEDVE